MTITRVGGRLLNWISSSLKSLAEVRFLSDFVLPAVVQRACPGIEKVQKSGDRGLAC